MRRITFGSSIVEVRWSRKKSMRVLILRALRVVCRRRRSWSSIKPEVSSDIGADRVRVTNGRSPITASQSITKGTFGSAETAEALRQAQPQAAVDSRRRELLLQKVRRPAHWDISTTA